MGEPTLHIQSPDRELTLPVTNEQPITIGRHERNQLCLDDPMISRFHCIVVRINDSVHVVDLQSSNGTMINGSAVSFAPLRPEDVMEVGQTRITLLRARYQQPPKPQPLRPQPKPQPQENPAQAPSQTGSASSPAGADSGFFHFSPINP